MPSSTLQSLTRSPENSQAAEVTGELENSHGRYPREGVHTGRIVVLYSTSQPPGSYFPVGINSEYCQAF